jgi:hypothetical protein
VKFWSDGVDQLLFTIDTNRSRGRFGADWETGRRRILETANNIEGARVIEVDYSPETRQKVSDTFFGGSPVPLKDCRGGPYYSYFFGLYSASHDWIIHCDADMFFGGAARRWVEEAIALYSHDRDVLFTAPHPGPPARDGRLRQLHGEQQVRNGVSGFVFPEFSTRTFLVQRSRFIERLTPLRAQPPPLRARLIAYLDGNPRYDLPENTISRAMNARSLRRFDFLGSAPGCWSLHPPYRCTDFFSKLPLLISRIEADDVPAAQRGDHDVNDSLVDWSEARTRLAHARWWRRFLQRVTTSCQ